MRCSSPASLEETMNGLLCVRQGEDEMEVVDVLGLEKVDLPR